MKKIQKVTFYKADRLFVKCRTIVSRQNVFRPKDVAPNPHWSAVQLNYRPPRRETYKISLAVVYTVDEMSVDKMPADEMSVDSMSLI
jgi:hypothetical protein